MKLPLQLLQKKKKFDPPKRPSAKIHYICGEKFKVVRPLARDMFDAVSFTVVGKTSWFLRVRGQYCFLEPKKQSRQFGKFNLQQCHSKTHSFRNFTLAESHYRLVLSFIP